MNPPIFRRGQVLRADQLQWISDMIEVMGNVEFSGDVEAAQDGGGLMISVPPPNEFWIRVTSHISGNQYAWQLLYHDDGTSFDDGPDDDASATDPAYEVHGITTVGSTIAWARRDRQSGQVLFEADQCPDGG